ncbi:hypothetical protein MKW92_043295 [Papaver armeniacum]|nr:hypothetical protein MKW92_043295 [Papaver armeniacum]
MRGFHRVILEKTPIPTRKSRLHSHKIGGYEINGDGDKDQLVVVKEEIKVSNKKNFDVKQVKSSELIKPQKNLVSKEKINLKVQEKLQGLAETENKYQSIVDIVMWRNIKISSLVFGIGNLILLSHIVTKDINFSFISAISYTNLICIAVIFLYKAILNREPINLDDSNIIHSVGEEEEEAVCLVKVVLPWINKFILEFRHLLSGDPATTMKFAVSLFILARLGSFITVWRVTVLGNFPRSFRSTKILFYIFKAETVCIVVTTSIQGNLYDRKNHYKMVTILHSFIQIQVNPETQFQGNQIDSHGIFFDREHTLV